MVFSGSGSRIFGMNLRDLLMEILLAVIVISNICTYLAKVLSPVMNNYQPPADFLAIPRPSKTISHNFLFIATATGPMA
uniref:Uncharacterized protein n=1 Tax=Rhodnius prolixus TaxID=13249 RepID=T1I951_RHOPR